MDSCLTAADFEGYGEGTLDEAAVTRVRNHLARCDACRKAHEQFKHDEALAEDVQRVMATDECELEQAEAPHAGALGHPLNEGQSDRSLQREATEHYPKIDGYRILDVLGQGGMGIVYRAVQTRLNRAVALKVLPAMVGRASPDSVLRFRREATAAARLHHTNIVPIYDFGESHDAYYCAMELVAGQPLNVVIRRFADLDVSAVSAVRLGDLLRSIVPGMQPTGSSDQDDPGLAGDSGSGSAGSSSGRGRIYYRQVARWVADAADGLHYAHGEGIVHRDIKPSNLILSTDGRLMIADFGLAKDNTQSSATTTGSLLGTLRYMSPEQAMAKRMRVDHRTDIYSLGATLYELLTLRAAFCEADDKELLGAIITREPIPPRKVTVSIPRDLETICLKAMEKSPDSRYATARALTDDLRRYINDLPIAAKPPGPIERTIKFIRRRKALVVAATAVTLLTLACAMWAVDRNRREDQRMQALEVRMQALFEVARDLMS